jgi:hypothetical protein
VRSVRDRLNSRNGCWRPALFWYHSSLTLPNVRRLVVPIELLWSMWLSSRRFLRRWWWKWLRVRWCQSRRLPQSPPVWRFLRLLSWYVAMTIPLLYGSRPPRLSRSAILQFSMIKLIWLLVLDALLQRRPGTSIYWRAMCRILVISSSARCSRLTRPWCANQYSRLHGSPLLLVVCGRLLMRKRNSDFASTFAFAAKKRALGATQPLERFAERVTQYFLGGTS